ncbi:MAG TPA: hypothetical protein VGM30_17075 [Puia sp.]|jgi:hypothetical protein
MDSKKAVFLPLDDKILDLFQGFLLDGEILQGITRQDVYIERKYYEFEETLSKPERIFRIIFIGPLVPLLVVILLVAAILKKFDLVANKLNYILESFSNLFFRKKKILKTQLIKSEKYREAIEENVPAFLMHCKDNHAKVFIYSYETITPDKKSHLDKLIHDNLIYSYYQIAKISDLKRHVINENISLLNSFLVVKEFAEISEAEKLGIDTTHRSEKNLELWKKSKSSSEGGKTEIEWNSLETLISMTRNIEYYLKAENRSFLSAEYVLYIEDDFDPFINGYIEKNYSRINNALVKKGMRFLYFPFFKIINPEKLTSLYDFVRYRYPAMYSLSNGEMHSAVILLLNKINPDEFYKMVLEEIKIPYFPRPALLRNIAGGFESTENKFTYTTLSDKKSEKELDDFFDWYLERIKIPNDGESVFYSKIPSPPEYDADWFFNEEAKELSAELISKIDKIKEKGEYGVLAEALMYMLEKIQNENPDIINKIKPIIDRKKLLQTKVVLSSILIDKHFKISLPDFNNVEVKMYALAKTVYILFLRHPEGIRFKELYEHKRELLEIYNKLTNKNNKEEINAIIKDLVDITNSSINIQCARIRGAFRDIMDEHIAKHYYIDGLNGEPKKIVLPRILIDVRC